MFLKSIENIYQHGRYSRCRTKNWSGDLISLYAGLVYQT